MIGRPTSGIIWHLAQLLLLETMLNILVAYTLRPHKAYITFCLSFNYFICVWNTLVPGHLGGGHHWLAATLASFSFAMGGMTLALALLAYKRVKLASEERPVQGGIEAVYPQKISSGSWPVNSVRLAVPLAGFECPWHTWWILLWLYDTQWLNYHHSSLWG